MGTPYHDRTLVSTETGEVRLGKAPLLVLYGLLAGKTNQEIAAALTLSEKTVKAHLTVIYKLSGCNNCRLFLAMYYTGRLPGGLMWGCGAAATSNSTAQYTDGKNAVGQPLEPVT